MKKLIAFSSLFVAGALFAALPQIDSYELAFDSETREVEVSYVLSGDAAVVTAVFACDGVDFEEGVVQTVMGDINRIVEPSETPYVFKWHPDRDLPQTFPASSQLTVKLTVWPLDHTPDYVAVDLSTKNNWFFYTSSNAVPGGVQNIRYKTDMVLLRRIPACNQRFRMGSPAGERGGQSSEAGTIASEVRHWVTLTKDFYIGVYELTQMQYRHITGGITGKFYSYECSDVLPVNSLRFVDVRSADWPTEPTPEKSGSVLGLVRSRTGLKTLDLPLDAQWEFACRAGTDTGLNNGTQLNYSSMWNQDPGGCPSLDVVAWWSANAETNLLNMTTGEMETMKAAHPVGEKPCNAFGLYDMHGNVAEYCRDWYSTGANYSDGSEVVDPIGPETGTHRVVHGGAVGNPSFGLRSASRSGRAPAVDWSDVNLYQNGMRLSCAADFRIPAE